MPKKTAHILVAEDNTMLAELMQKVLRAHKFQSQVVHDGQQAIQAMDAIRPALLLLDLLMPQIDGFQVIEHIRSKRYSFPFVVITNLSDAQTRKKCFDLGCKDFVVKSDIDEDGIMQYVDKWVTHP